MQANLDKLCLLTDTSEKIIKASSTFIKQPNVFNLVNAVQAFHPILSRIHNDRRNQDATDSARISESFQESTQINIGASENFVMSKKNTSRLKNIRTDVNLSSAIPENDADENSNQQNYFECPICYENGFTNGALVTTCGHVFCERCIKQCLNITKKCPVCKQRQQFRNLIKLHS